MKQENSRLNTLEICSLLCRCGL